MTGDWRVVPNRPSELNWREGQIKKRQAPLLDKSRFETIDACSALAYNGVDLFAKGSGHDSRN